MTMPLLAEEFQAPVTDTRWQVVESPLECSLMQTIPGFGEAGFYRKNSGPLQLQFLTHSQPAEQSQVQFQIAPAPWLHSDELIPLTTQSATKGQTRFIVEGNPAQQALSQLQEGRFAYLEYRSQYYHNNISVKLSTIKLNDSLPAFQQCLANLHPDTFDEINQLTVYFGLEQSTLDAAAQKALNRLARYARLDESITQIRIASHTDSHGKRKLNAPLSDARAQAVKNFLVNEHQIPPQLISINSFVDFKPAASNKTPKGRAYNRRAEITLIR